MAHDLIAKPLTLWRIMRAGVASEEGRRPKSLKFDRSVR
jgi:hypothetical protein